MPLNMNVDELSKSSEDEEARDLHSIHQFYFDMCSKTKGIQQEASDSSLLPSGGWQARCTEVQKREPKDFESESEGTEQSECEDQV